MEAKMKDFFGSVSNFPNSDHLPWSDGDIVKGCVCEFAEAEKRGSNGDVKKEYIMRLLWALVLSKRYEDVQRGIAILRASLDGRASPEQPREKIFYLLAVGYFRSGDYTRSRQLVERCLEIAPDWRQALGLKKALEEKITKDWVIGIEMVVNFVGFLFGGIAVAHALKN